MAGLKLFKRKKELVFLLEAGGSLKQVFWKVSQKLQENNCAVAAGPQQTFTRDCFSNLLKLSMVFGPVKKSSENVYVFLKTKSKHQVN